MKKLKKIVCSLLLTFALATPHPAHANANALAGILAPFCRALQIQSNSEISVCVRNIEYFFIGIAVLGLAYAIYLKSNKSHKINKNKLA